MRSMRTIRRRRGKANLDRTDMAQTRKRTIPPWHRIRLTKPPFHNPRPSILYDKQKRRRKMGKNEKYQ